MGKDEKTTGHATGTARRKLTKIRINCRRDGTDYDGSWIGRTRQSDKTQTNTETQRRSRSRERDSQATDLKSDLKSNHS